MASPFSIFRRHQAALLAVFGVALMIAFVVLPAVIQLQQTGGGGGNYRGDTVLVWKNGEVSENDVAAIRRRRDMTGEFLTELRKIAIGKRGGDEMNLRRDGGMLQRLSNNTRLSAVETMLLAQKGQDMGMAVDDAAVRAFLHAVTDDVFTSEAEMNAAIDLAIGNKTTEAAMFNALKQEILAQQVLMMGFGGSTTTPSEAWEYYNRLNRRLSAEFVPIETADYVSQIEDPSSGELQKFFDAHKHELPELNSPEPGFKIPLRREFYYVSAEFAKFLDEEKKKVTAEEVQEYYQANKESFRVADPSSPVDEFDPDDPRGALPRPPRVDAAEPVDETPPNENGAEPLNEEESGEEPSGNETPSEEPAETSEEPAGGCQDEATEPEGADEEVADEPTADEDADDAPPVDSTPDAAPDDTTTTNDPPDGTPPTEDAEPSDDTATDDTGATDTTPPAGGTSSDDLTLPEPKYRPLEEVEDDIRVDIASPRAQQRLDAAMEKVRGAVEEHDRKTIDFKAYGEGTDPGLFTAEKLAKELQLGHGATGLIDIVSLYQKRDELDIVQSSEGFGPRAVGFLQLAFRPGLLDYQPFETQVGRPAKVFLTWKTAEVEGKVPELADVKDEVTRAWKMQQARDLAKDAAEKLAAGLDGDKSLKAQVGGQHEVIVPPGAFTYYDPLSLMMMRFQGQPPQPGSIEGIEDETTDAVKKEVFQMAVGEIRVVPSADKSVYYVVRVASDDSSTDEAREKFMQSLVDAPNEGPPFELQYVGSGDKREVFFDWYEQIEKEYEVEQVKPEFFQETGG